MFRKILLSLEKQIYNSLGFILLLLVQTRMSYVIYKSLDITPAVDYDLVWLAQSYYYVWLQISIGFILITVARTYRDVKDK